MLLVTTERIAGREIEPLGIVEGSSVQTVHAGKDIMNSLKTLVGGELTSYTEMMEKARTLATDRCRCSSMCALFLQRSNAGSC